MILFVDHFDSYSYNLVHSLIQEGAKVTVRTPNQIRNGEEKNIPFSSIVLSPGPGHPQTQNTSQRLIREYGHSTPILGVCLGHQIIAHTFGASVVRLKSPRHGFVDTLNHEEIGIFKKTPPSFGVMRYHSLHIERTSLPSQLRVLAQVDHTIMAIQHTDYPWICGVQFHPESFASEYGTHILSNFIRLSNGLEPKLAMQLN